MSNPNENKIYNDDFYSRIHDWSYESAKIIVPLILNYKIIKSVIDIGCGDGTWLSVFNENGICDFMGVDGNYVNLDKLRIPKENFISHDLDTHFKMDKKFDLAISLEVGEHLQEESAVNLVNTLTNLSDLVLFSAAIPHQGGDNHINEQWPEFWVDLFKKNNFLCLNSLKFKLWDNPNVAFFYKQNIFIFFKNDQNNDAEKLNQEYERYKIFPITIIHPELYIKKVNQLIRQKNKPNLPKLLVRKAKRRIKKYLHKNFQ